MAPRKAEKAKARVDIKVYKNDYKRLQTVKALPKDKKGMKMPF